MGFGTRTPGPFVLVAVALLARVRSGWSGSGPSVAGTAGTPPLLLA